MKPVWFDIDLETIGEYEVWKPATLRWARSVDWAKVTNLLRSHLVRFPGDGVEAAWRAASAAKLSRADRAGLDSLFAEPIYATPAQISNGGHRIVAMRTQGVRWALGVCDEEDIGLSVDAERAYRPRPGDAD